MCDIHAEIPRLKFIALMGTKLSQSHTIEMNYFEGAAQVIQLSYKLLNTFSADIPLKFTIKNKENSSISFPTDCSGPHRLPDIHTLITNGNILRSIDIPFLLPAVKGKQTFVFEVAASSADDSLPNTYDVTNFRINFFPKATLDGPVLRCLDPKLCAKIGCWTELIFSNKSKKHAIQVILEFQADENKMKSAAFRTEKFVIPPSSSDQSTSKYRNAVFVAEVPKAKKLRILAAYNAGLKSKEYTIEIPIELSSP
jgi:hypothetical protein